MRNMETTTQIDPPGLSPKKTLFIMVTVVGCIAILWPKVFYPMMFGGVPIKHNTIKDHRSGGTEKSYKSTCCEVILDKDAFLNDSLTVGESLYRKHINLYSGEIISLRQERPPHLRPDTIHPAMRERGRAIPATQTIPIVERARTPSSPPPRVVEGRPGPIPGMRPPLGAGSVHQTPQKTTSMGFIMPLYTVGIVAFFIYTIMKILFKKPVPNSPYGGTRSDPSFHKEVFGHEKSCCSGTKLGLIDAADEQLKIRENSTTNLTKDASENIQQHNTNNNNISNGHASPIHTSSNDLLSNNKLLLNNDTHTITEKHQQQQHKTEQSLNENSNNNRNNNNINNNNINNNNNNNNKYNDDNDDNLLTIDNRNDHNQLLLSDNNDDNNHLNYYNNNENLNIDNNDNKKIDTSDTAKTITEHPHQQQHQHDQHQQQQQQQQHQQHRSDNNENKFERKKFDELDHHLERSVVVLGMELTASCEGGQKWNRPPTPVFIQHVEHSTLKDDVDEKQPDPQPIYLEGALPHESQILVADSKIEKENIIIDDEYNDGSVDEPAVVLSSKMTLSLINLSSSDNYSSDENIKEYSSQGKDSPLDNDMEIINGEKQQDNKREQLKRNDEN